MSKEIYCKNCAFFNNMEEECRRHAPAHRSPMEFIIPAHLQAISLSLINLARMNPDDFDDDLRSEVTEYYTPSKWPSVKENDWCGEFEEAAE